MKQPARGMTAHDTSANDPSRPLWRTYLAFLGPMVVSNILQALSGSVNGIFIGQMLGTHSLAAIAGMFPIIFLFVSMVIGIGAGASVLIGQAWGAGETAKVRQIAGTALVIGALIGLAVAVIGAPFARELLVLLGTPGEILGEAAGYATIMMMTMPVLLVYVLFTQLLRGVSDTVTPLQALILSTAVGLVATPALIQGWAGLPQLGIRSAAIAGLVSTVVSLVYLAVRLRVIGSPLAPDAALLRSLRIDGPLLGRVLKIGLPTGVQMIVMSLAGLAILSFVNPFGSHATAAYGAVNQVVNYIQFPALSIAITASILGAQSIGAGHAERLGAILRTGLWLNVAITGSLIVLAYAVSRWLLGLFITDDDVLELAQRLLHIVLWSMVLFGFQAVIGGIMRASGTVLVPVGISVACILLVELPCAWWLSHSHGIEGVWMAYPITFAVMLVLQASYYHFVWRHRTIERLV